MIVAIILTAGESSRMGRAKALLPIEGRSFIEKIVSALKASRVGRIIVVLGHDAEEIQKEIGHLPVLVVLNKDYKKGQLSSLVAALQSLKAEKSATKVDGVLVHLVDHPFLSAALVDHMIDRFYESKKLIVLPRYKGRRGHPVIFSSRLFPELLSTPLEQGAKAVVHAHRDETLEIETEEEGIAIDIDTPEEYRQHVGRE
ncbi:MAG: nucleotidyltransferase family protein [Candidatus Binatia bacterium]